jgi:DNA topoisomerase 2-associated protein PAT1
MSQGDKNFITRIQVSQLVTEDPYTEDFYYQVVSHIRSTRLAAASGPLNAQIGEKASGPGGGGGGGGGNGKGGERKLTRRENAMVRMAQQVQRIVDNAQKRPKMTQRMFLLCHAYILAPL